MVKEYDVAVIGGGVIGGLILRELSRYNLQACMLEKENDVSMGSSRANTGIVHGGFDAVLGTNKAKFNVLGAKMMPKVAKELGVKYQQNGTLVVGFNDIDAITINKLYDRGIINGVKGLYLLDKKQLVKKEPNISPNAKCALYCKTAGIICPYELTISAIGNAMDNGAELFTNFEVANIERGEKFTVKSSDGKAVVAKYVINCAGINGDKIAGLVGDNSFTIGARKGEYILLDKSNKGMLNHTLFSCPSASGKGIVVTHTVDGNLLLGPTAVNNQDKEDKTTTAKGLNEVKENALKLCEKLPLGDAITSFAGVRAYCDKNDFIIEESKFVPNFINVVGIESPGLTSAPAIAKHVVGLLKKKGKFNKNKNFNPLRKPDYFFKNLTIEQKNQVIQRDSDYGKIICRCEEITLGEILRAVRENPKATTVDGVKRRTRAGMGRCQGGFCQPNIVKIIANELNLPLEQVEKDGKNSKILVGKTK